MTISRSDPDAANVIRIVAALAMDEEGRTLLVRKRGTAAFMQPGGKLIDGESPLVALAREIREELGCGVEAGSGRMLGTFSAPAVNEPGSTVQAQLFAVTLAGKARAQAEIEEAIWVDPVALDGLTLAPLTQTHVMPLARALKALP
ncbi:MAG TPA: NUDIX domain-containing protein [Allosphingosinicella sp.]|nr:NUDIX domain-containing protein [Allosphingosinicella sp.]